ncbi:MAG: carboxypeptidase regulatory-like domain-containing protein [Gemmatimonadetes bacterium]|nr:carboxypeptidase regulatory-like domain-containing protein [Gemmatimonadota bacterium]
MLRQLIFLTLAIVTALGACAPNDALAPRTTQNANATTGGGTDTSAAAPPVSNAVVRGRVHDVAAGTDSGPAGAIAGATVQVIAMDASGAKLGVYASTVSDASGDFAFPSIPARTWFLVLNATGYRTSEYVISTRQAVLVVSAIMTRTTAAASPAPTGTAPTAPPDSTARPASAAPATSAPPSTGTSPDTSRPATPPPAGGAIVRGQVHDFASGADTGRVGAIAGATVQVIRMDAMGKKIGVEATTVSDANGAFQFTGLPAQTFFLDFTAPGYRTSEYVISTRQAVLTVSAIMTRGTSP